MLPSRRKKLIIIVLSVLLLGGFIWGIYFLTKMIKTQEVVFKSDAYPTDVMYIGITYDEANDYRTLTMLDADFKKTDYSLNTFYEVRDYHVVDHRLVVYSDAINEVAYNMKDDVFSFNEIDSFYSNTVDIKIGDHYLVYFTGSNLEYRAYNTTEKSKSKVIAEGVEDKRIAVVQDTVFYRDFEGIVAYDMQTGTKTTVVPTAAAFYPYIVDSTELYILVKSFDRYAMYSLQNGKVTHLNDALNLTNINILSLFDRGVVYEQEDPHAIKAYNAFFGRKEGNGFLTKSKVNNMYFIDGVYCFLDLVDEEENHSYSIYNVSDGKLKTIDQAYDKIIKVQQEEY